MFLSVLLNQYYASGIISFGSGSNKNEKADKLKIMKVASRLTFYNTVYKTIWRIFTKNNWHRLFPPHLHGLITIIVRGFSGPRYKIVFLILGPSTYSASCSLTFRNNMGIGHGRIRIRILNESFRIQNTAFN